MANGTRRARGGNGGATRISALHIATGSARVNWNRNEWELCDYRMNCAVLYSVQNRKKEENENWNEKSSENRNFWVHTSTVHTDSDTIAIRSTVSDPNEVRPERTSNVFNVRAINFQK